MSRLIAWAVLAAFAAAPAAAEDMHFHAELSGASEVPPNTSAGTGTVDATVDSTTRQMRYTMTFSGLSGPATMAHFHGPAAAGANAGVQAPIGANVQSPVTGNFTMTEAQFQDLLNGQWYANVHSGNYPTGEIRGQMGRR
jgi:hypothetical protein